MFTHRSSPSQRSFCHSSNPNAGDTCDFMVIMTETHGSNVLGLFSRLLRSTQRVSSRVPSRRKGATEAFARTSLGPTTDGGPNLSQASPVTGPYLDSSVVRREGLEEQQHPQVSTADSCENFGYASSDALNARFILGGEISRGGNGVIRLLTERTTGEEFACKTLPKSLHAAGASFHVSTRHEEIVGQHIISPRILYDCLYLHRISLKPYLILAPPGCDPQLSPY